MKNANNDRDERQMMSKFQSTHLFDIGIITGGEILIECSKTNDGQRENGETRGDDTSKFTPDERGSC